MARCRVEAFDLAPPVLAVAALALFGCSPTPTAVIAPPPAAVPAAAPAAATAPGPAPAAASPAPGAAAGFTPLATPQQVVGAMAVGRSDPFAAPQQVGPSAAAGAGSGSASSAGLPQGLRLTGVIRTGATSRAFVQVGDRSAALCPGPRGRCPGGAAEQPLLPAGWTVTAIDADHGLMALRFGTQRQVLRVSP